MFGRSVRAGGDLVVEERRHAAPDLEMVPLRVPGRGEHHKEEPEAGAVRVPRHGDGAAQAGEVDCGGLQLGKLPRLQQQSS